MDIMNADLYAGYLMLWCKVANYASKNLADLCIPVRCELAGGDVIKWLEFDSGSVYFYVDGEDNPYEWDNFDEEVNQDLIEQAISFINDVSQISKLTKRV